MKGSLAIPRGTIALRPGQVARALGHLARPEAPGVVRAFEGAFADAVGVRHAIALSSGKAALALILRGLGVPAGAGVVVAAYNVPEVPSLLAGMGLKVRFADIDGRSYAPRPEQVERAAGDARVLLATHLYGNPADLEGLRQVAEARGMLLIEDCAQALGATWGGHPVGFAGRAALYSFGLMKSLNTFRGGMVTTDDDDLAAAVRRLAQAAPLEARAPVALAVAESLGVWLATRRSVFGALVHPALRALDALAPAFVDQAVKMRPAELESGALDPARVTARMRAAQAATGLMGLPHVASEAAARSANAAHLLEALADAPGLDLPRSHAAARPAWTSLVVRSRARLEVRRALLRAGVDTTFGYLAPCHHLLPDAAPPGGCPQTDALARECLYLPLGEGLGRGDMDRIAGALREALASTGTESP